MYDLSLVTHTLSGILTDALAASPSNPVWGTSPPTYTVSCQHPSDVAQSGFDCDINLYMFHVAEDRSTLNNFWTQKAISGQPGTPKQPVAFEPLCLDLHYLLSANSQSGYVNEQQAMSIGMRAFHENAIVRLPTPTPTGMATSEITLTLEHPSWDELSRLWQALECPMRMTATYRAAVVTLMPEAPPPDLPTVFAYYTLLAAPAAPGDGSTPELYGTMREVAFATPAGPSGAYVQTPASVAPGQTFTLRGSFVLDADTIDLLTVAADGTVLSTQDITGWKVPLTRPYPVTPAGGVPVALMMPAGGGVVPGRYLLQASGATGTSNRVPLSVAALVDPAGGPVLAAGPGGAFSFTTAGVPLAGAELRLGSVPLTQGPLVPGGWELAASKISFIPPAGLSGTYAVRLRVADIESDPALWVSL